MFLKIYFDISLLLRDPLHIDWNIGLAQAEIELLLIDPLYIDWNIGLA